MVSLGIILGIVLIAFLILKFSKVEHRITLVLFILAGVFLFSTISWVANSSNSFDVDSFEGIIDISKLYLGWLSNCLKNFGVLAGNAIKLDWTSTDSTLFDSNSSSSLFE
jgi:hypothetical protein